MSRTLHPGSSPLKSRKLRALGTPPPICLYLLSMLLLLTRPLWFLPKGNGLYEVPVVGLSARLKASSGTGNAVVPVPGTLRGNAAYVDANGRWWDESYSLCRSAPVTVATIENNADGGAQPPTEDCQLLSVIQNNPKPLPQEFGSYVEYEMALVHWKDTMESALHSAEIMLPSPQGRCHYRPAFNPNRTSQRRIVPLFGIRCYV